LGISRYRTRSICAPVLIASSFGPAGSTLTLIQSTNGEPKFSMRVKRATGLCVAGSISG